MYTHPSLPGGCLSESRSIIIALIKVKLKESDWNKKRHDRVALTKTNKAFLRRFY